MKLNWEKFIDKYLGIPFILVLGLFPKSKSIPEKPKQILVIRFVAIGDTLCLLPTFEKLFKKYVDAEFDILIKRGNKEVIDCYGKFDNVIVFEKGNYIKLLKSFKKYDLVFDTEMFTNLSAILSLWLGKFRMGFSNQFRSILYNLRSKFDNEKHVVQNYLDFARKLDIDCDDVDELVSLNVSVKQKKELDDFFHKNNVKGDIICLSPISAVGIGRTRMWVRENFSEVAHFYLKKGFTVLLNAAPNEKDFINSIVEDVKIKSEKNKIDLSKLVSVVDVPLMQKFEMFKRCKLVISCDTGTTHMAAAQGTKTIGLYGPNTPVLWKPYGKDNIGIYHKLSCSPCIINTKGLVPDCSRTENRYECMKLITVPEVLKAGNDLLGLTKMKVLD